MIPTSKLKELLRARRNAAIDRINEKPDDFRELYYEKVDRAMSEMPAKVKKIGQGVKKTLRVPKWNPWVAYGKRDFDETELIVGWSRGARRPAAKGTSKEVVAANSEGESSARPLSPATCGYVTRGADAPPRRGSPCGGRGLLLVPRCGRRSHPWPRGRPPRASGGT